MTEGKEGAMEEREFVDAVGLAIESEIEAFAFYQGVAEQVMDEDMKELFHNFAEEEKKHKALLEDVLESGTFNLVPQETRDYKVSKVIDLPKLSVDMKPQDAIGLAMKKEEAAMEHYAGLAEVSGDRDLKELFEKLAGMERQHKFKLEKVFVDRGYPERW